MVWEQEEDEYENYYGVRIKVDSMLNQGLGRRNNKNLCEKNKLGEEGGELCSELAEGGIWVRQSGLNASRQLEIWDQLLESDLCIIKKLGSNLQQNLIL